MKIIPYSSAYWPAVERIHAEGIATGQATFETEPKQQAAFETESVPGASFLAIDADGGVQGWATLWPVSDRCCYAGVAEVSVYISEKGRGQGIGTLLLDRLIQFSESHNIWTLTAGVFPENTASTHLHMKAGFRLLGVRERIAKHGNVWRDNQMLERRSKKIGND